MAGYEYAADRYFDTEIQENEDACYGTAVENGFSVDQADNCDDGDVGCPNCPWKKPQLAHGKATKKEENEK